MCAWRCAIPTPASIFGWPCQNRSTDPPVLATAGDLGPEGLVFIHADQSPNGRHLLVVGNEVSGTTAVLQLNLTY